jgi:nucleoside phosphorylase
MSEVIILSSTPAEFQGLVQELDRINFRNFTYRIIQTGPGKINAAIAVTKLLVESIPAFLLGTGTSGTLEYGLKSGDVVAAREVLISDWRQEEHNGYQVGNYGEFEYGSATPERVESMVIKSSSDLIEKFSVKLAEADFISGRILSSDAFVSGEKLKLSLGKIFGCRICEMEAGAISYTAGRLAPHLPWFHLRVVADTLDDTLETYFEIEKDMTQILGQKVRTALEILDLHWETFGAK